MGIVPGGAVPADSNAGAGEPATAPSTSPVESGPSPNAEPEPAPPVVEEQAAVIVADHDQAIRDAVDEALETVPALGDESEAEPALEDDDSLTGIVSRLTQTRPDESLALLRTMLAEEE